MSEISRNPLAKVIPDAGLLGVVDDRVTISSETAYPPGSRVEFQLPASTEPKSLPGTADGTLNLSGKVVSVKPGGRGYAMVVRLHNLTRAESACLFRKAGAS
jgi:hypothetical protein